MVDFIGDARRQMWRRRRDERATEVRKRKQRALQQPILLIDHRATDASIEFEILGTSGTYAVQFQRGSEYVGTSGSWSCSCPDFARRVQSNHRSKCKHIFFVLARVLHLSLDGAENVAAHFRTVDEVEAAMTTHQIARQFRYDPAAAAAAAIPPSLPDEFTETAASDGDEGKMVTQRPFAGDDCGICMEQLSSDQKDLSTIVYCSRTCGKSVHRACFERYLQVKKEPQCPYCRSYMLPCGMNLHISKKRRHAS